MALLMHMTDSALMQFHDRLAVVHVTLSQSDHAALWESA